LTLHRHSSIDVVVPVFNAGDRIGRNIRDLLQLTENVPADIRILVCDDGSGDTTGQVLRSLDHPRLRCVHLPSNSGRANACNRGAALGRGEYLLFLDVDCRPEQMDYFLVLAREAAAGAGLVYGPITDRGAGFWQRYLRQVEQRRNRQAALRLHLLAMTTGNLLVRRELFVDVGGFCDAYRYYGFEDKDLIVRLLDREPEIVFDPRLSVLHDARNTVTGYCRKMREAACYTAPIFSARHPEAYRHMTFSRLDPDLAVQPFRSIMRGAGRYGAGSAEKVAAWALDRTNLPWSLQLLLVRSAAAFSYLKGAAERRPV